MFLTRPGGPGFNPSKKTRSVMTIARLRPYTIVAQCRGAEADWQLRSEDVNIIDLGTGRRKYKGRYI